MAGYPDISQVNQPQQDSFGVSTCLDSNKLRGFAKDQKYRLRAHDRELCYKADFSERKSSPSASCTTSATAIRTDEYRAELQAVARRYTPSGDFCDIYAQRERSLAIWLIFSRIISVSLILGRNSSNAFLVSRCVLNYDCSVATESEFMNAEGSL
ncbi:uncharacterized protein MYCFIDRAFT_207337 [Pseudocercospora fijiensis CIRAD86]|uniref:Uncharacterized protein n=1 Tax=Pseudocercospora fijiensis (strain CIRAD86) TaxID=383855 RepID=M3B5G8_PSEFD|nr:uncharacterized protein MYCFIDRAFT_207337 [Pseudocercospora fijiensis CIRAD86]EME84607.1 hypothetical protein MYCFIDRAFT_207337 [Pseudocercospora fijiensis CIRAD86]